MPGTNSFVEVSEGTGKKMQTKVSTIGADDVHSEAVFLVDDSGIYLPTLPVSFASNVNAVISANSDFNLSQVGGSAVSTSSSGTQKVGIVGNAGATMDSTVGAGAAPTNQLVVGSVFNSSAPAPTTGQAMAQQADQSGNLRVFDGIGLAALSVWNNGTALNSTQTIFSNSGTPAVLVHLVQSSGSFSAGAITFEISYDNSNWVTIPADAVLDPSDSNFTLISLPYTLVTSTNKPFVLLGKGWQGLRIKLSTAITGTGTVTPNYSLLPYQPSRPVSLISGGSGASINIARVAGNTVATSASGVMKVGIVGASGSTLDTTFGTGASAPTDGLAVMGKVNKESGTPVSGLSDGTAIPFLMDQSGGLRCMPHMSYNAATTWSSGTALNTTAGIFIFSGCPEAIVTLDQGSTITGGAITFEVSYNSSGTWSTIPADAVMDPATTSLSQISLPYTLQQSTLKSFLITNKGWEGLRIKLSTVISGTGQVNIYPRLLPYAYFTRGSQDYLAGTAIDTNSGNKSAGTQRVVLATDQPSLTNSLLVKELGAGTASQSSVANSTANVTLLSSNTNRLGATFFNDDTAGTGTTVKVRLGATASASNFSVAVVPQGYYELPFRYLGQIDAIAGANTGNMRITELTA